MKTLRGNQAEIAVATPSHVDPAMRTVLMIDYFFPPVAGAGVQRTLNYVKHLGEFGWSPIVLTVHPGEHAITDISLLEAIPPTVGIARTASLEPVRFIKRLTKRPGDHRSAKEPGRYDGRPAWHGARWIRDIERWILFPDARIGWLPFAVARALAIGRHQRIDAIYSTSTIVTSHLIANVVSKLLNRPWVADFQDWWVEDCVGSLHRWAGSQVEHMILRNAARTTFATEPLRQLFHRKYPTIPLQRLVAIPMGFDPKAFQGIKPIARSKFTILHFGSFYGPRSPGPFLKALAECLATDPVLAQRLEVLLYGKFDGEMLRLTEDLVREGHLNGIVHLAGVIPYKAGLQQILSADLLLLVTAPGKSGQTHIPSKLFEYLATGRPILALAPEGGAADIVQEANAGVVIDPTDVKRIRGAILELYGRWTKGELVFPVDPAVVAKYTWRELSARLAATLGEALAQHRCPGRNDKGRTLSSGCARKG